MIPVSHSHLPATRVDWLCTGVLFAAFYLYLRWVVDPQIIHAGQSRDPLFLLTGRFLTDFVQHPGDLAQYCSTFLLRLAFYPWLGAIAFTGLALLLSLSTRRLLTTPADRYLRVIHFTPALFLVIIFGRYTFPLPALLGLLAAVVGLATYVSLSVRSSMSRGLLFLIIAAILYLTVAGPALVFILLAGLFEAIARPRAVLAASCLLAGLALPYLIGGIIFNMTPSSAYLRHLPFDSQNDRIADAATACLFGFYPLAAVPIWRLRRSAAPSPASRRLESPAGWYRTSRITPVIHAAVLLALAVAAGWLSLNQPARLRLALQFYAQHERWDDLLSQAPRISRWDSQTRFLFHRALFHRGQLLDCMFAYPQDGGDYPVGWLFPSREAAQSAYPELARLYFELGRTNPAEHMASEAVELFGDGPQMLRRLALINVAKGRPDAARIYLNAMVEDMVYGEWARDILKQLNADESLADNVQVQRLRRSASGPDFVPEPTIIDKVEPALLRVLEKDPANRMAFEYLVACWMLTGHPDLAAARVADLPALGYSHIPRHMEEAVLYCQNRRPGERIDLGGMTIRPETRQRFEQFARRLRTASLESRKKELANEFGDTCWYYIEFRESAPAGPGGWGHAKGTLQ